MMYAATGWNIHQLNMADPVITSHYFNNPQAGAAGYTATANPVMDGYVCQPAMVYTSYAQFQSDVTAGIIASHFKFVVYDPEAWAKTPANEQQQPEKYMKLFSQLAHAKGYRVIQAPARDLAQTDQFCTKNTGETFDHWYLRCEIPAAAAEHADIYVVQAEMDEPDTTAFDNLVTQSYNMAKAANPFALVLAELSMASGTVAQIVACAQSVNVDGFYLSIPNATQIPDAISVLQLLAGNVSVASPGDQKTQVGSSV